MMDAPTDKGTPESETPRSPAPSQPAAEAVGPVAFAQPPQETASDGSTTVEDEAIFAREAEESTGRRAKRERAEAPTRRDSQWSTTSYEAVPLWNDLAEMRKELVQESAVPTLVAGSAASVTSALSVGYVLWTIRGGWLVTSVLAQMPAWRLVDPLIVLDNLDEDPEGSKRDQDDEDDSLESLLERSARERRSRATDVANGRDEQTVIA
jgi:hypothetical protein